MYLILTTGVFIQLNVRLQDVLLPEGKGQLTINHAADSPASQQVRLRFIQLNCSNTM